MSLLRATPLTPLQSDNDAVKRGRRVLIHASEQMDPALAMVGLVIVQVRIHRADDAWPYAPVLLGLLIALAPALIAVRRVVPMLASAGLAVAAVLSLLLAQTDWVVLAGCALAMYSVAARCRLRSAVATLVTISVVLPVLATKQWSWFYSTAYRQIEESGRSSDGTTWFTQGIPLPMLNRIIATHWEWWWSLGLMAAWLLGLALHHRGEAVRRTLGEQTDDLWDFLRARQNRLGLDLVLATAVCSLVLVGIRHEQLWDGKWWGAPPWIALFVAYSPMILVLRRIVPVVPCVCLGLAAYVAFWQTDDRWPVLTAFAIALYSLASLRPLRTSIPVAAGILASLPPLTAYTNEQVLTLLFPYLKEHVSDVWIPFTGSRYGWEYKRMTDQSWPVSLSLSMALPLCLGVLVRLARRVGESRKLEEKLERQDTRARVARDLHDVVAHHVSLMVIQAEDGLDLVPRERSDLALRLERIGTAGRLALAELDRTLAALRNPDRPVDPELAPQPMLDDLHRLVTLAESPDLTIDLRLRGDLDGVPAGHQVAAYRLIQEALTNVMRHADARKAAVTVTGSEDRLSIDVTDDGRGFEPADAKANGRHGLAGMRERVRIHGGTFGVESAPGSGTTVRAELPR
jgi:signal transduction histidine kinase